MPDLDTSLFSNMVSYMRPSTTTGRTQILRRYCGDHDGTDHSDSKAVTLWLKLHLNEKVYFRLLPLVHRNRDRSESEAPVGIEVVREFFSDVGELKASCGPDMTDLLTRFMRACAYEQAAALGRKGEWHDALTFL